MTASIISAITGVFTAVGEWIITFLNAVVGIFWTGEALTFLGVLALCGLAIALFLLFCNVVTNFIRFR